MHVRYVNSIIKEDLLLDRAEEDSAFVFLSGLFGTSTSGRGLKIPINNQTMVKQELYLLGLAAEPP